MKIELQEYHTEKFTSEQRRKMTNILVGMEQIFGINIMYNLEEREETDWLSGTDTSLLKEPTPKGLWGKLKTWVHNVVFRWQANDYQNKFIDFQLFCFHELKKDDVNTVLATFTQKQLQEALTTRNMMDWYEQEKTAGRIKDDCEGENTPSADDDKSYLDDSDLPDGCCGGDSSDCCAL